MQKPQQAEERKEKPTGRGVVRAVPSGDQLVLSLDKVRVNHMICHAPHRVLSSLCGAARSPRT